MLYKDIQSWESRKWLNNITFFFSCVWYRQWAAFGWWMNGEAYTILNVRSFFRTFFGFKTDETLKIRIAYRQRRSNFPRRGRKRKIGKCVFSGFGNDISRGWERKSTTERFATGRSWPCTWKISFVGKDQFNNWQFCILKIRLIVCFCSDLKYMFNFEIYWNIQVLSSSWIFIH